MLTKLYEKDTNIKIVREIVEQLERGAIIIVPTDTIYAYACSFNHPKSVDKIQRLKRDHNQHLSLLCSDLSQISKFTKPITNPTFKLMRNNLPGAFTFILDANSNVPKLFKSKKKTIGIRVPDNQILKTIVDELCAPLISTSIHANDNVLEYITDPELINEMFGNKVDIVIDGGYGSNVPSTIIDCTSEEPVIIRQGVGVLN